MSLRLTRAAQADLHPLKLGQEVESTLLLLVFWCKTTKAVEGADFGLAMVYWVSLLECTTTVVRLVDTDLACPGQS